MNLTAGVQTMCTHISVANSRTDSLPQYVKERPQVNPALSFLFLAPVSVLRIRLTDIESVPEFGSSRRTAFESGMHTNTGWSTRIFCSPISQLSSAFQRIFRGTITLRTDDLYFHTTLPHLLRTRKIWIH